jgi:hypothetical protein
METIHPLDVYKPREIDTKLVKKFKYVWPDAQGRKFVHLKIFDSSASFYFDGVYLYEWVCFCKACKAFNPTPNPKCTYLVCKPNRKLPYCLDRQLWNNGNVVKWTYVKGNMYSHFLKGTAWSPCLYPELTSDLTHQEVANHKYKYKTERERNLAKRNIV